MLAGNACSFNAVLRLCLSSHFTPPAHSRPFRYGNINLDPKAYKGDASPLAIINEDYDPPNSAPFPGPRNYGPDSPFSYLPEAAVDPAFPKRMVSAVRPDLLTPRP